MPSGGSVLGRGAYGTTMTIACDADDHDTLCSAIGTDGPIEVYRGGRPGRWLHGKEASRFRSWLEGSAYVAKVMRANVFGTARHNFMAEMRHSRQIERVLGPVGVRRYTMLPAIGIRGKGGVYAVLSRRAPRDVSQVPKGALSADDLDRLVRQLLGCVAILEGKHYAHKDIKPANIVQLPHAPWFALIDWGLAGPIGPGHRLSGDPMTTMPMAFYLDGMPAWLAVRMMWLWCRFAGPPGWFGSRIFNEVYGWSADGFWAGLGAGAGAGEGAHADVFSIGATVAYLVHAHRLPWKRYRDWVHGAISMGFATAGAALRAWRRLHTVQN